MSTGALVSLEEYLNTSYQPDVEFVDGVLVERNVGTRLHAALQLIVAMYLQQCHKSHRIRTYVEARLLVDEAAGRYRVPDILVLSIPYHKTRVITDIPAIIVEIKSPEDTFDDIHDRCVDYHKLGVPNILMMDPEHRQVWKFEPGSFRQLTGDSTKLGFANTVLAFPFAALFAELDED